MRKLFPVLLLFLAMPAAVARRASRRRRPASPSPRTHRPPTSARRAPSAARPRRPCARRERKRRVKAKAAAAPAVSPALQAIAACESGGNPRAISANGTYRGKYQFSTATWAGRGRQGDPAAASEAEQDRRAAMLYARSGAGQWPVCGS